MLGSPVSLLSHKPDDRARFHLRRRLGAGSMGVVYEAYDRERDEVVALKRLIHAQADDLYHFKREFRALADIVHPNLVTLHELFFDDGRCFFTMELVDGVRFLEHVRPHAPGQNAHTIGTRAGDTLPDEPPTAQRPKPAPEVPTDHQPESSEETIEGVAHKLSAYEARPVPATPTLEKLSIQRLREALAGLASGVFALHGAGKIHRDLKPSNILVEQTGRVVILDFGLAADIPRGGISESKPEQFLTGTAAYMAPEQAALREITPASDWYAFGVILYEALAGERPFVGSVTDIIGDKQHKPAPRVHDLVPDLPQDLCDLAMALLATDPEQRPTGEQVLAHFGLRPQAQVEPVMARHHAITAGAPAAVAVPIGREEAFEQLREGLRVTQSGQPMLMCVHGYSGVGKSTLIQHFFATLQHQRSTTLVLRGRCHVRESVPYKAFDEIIDQLGQFLVSLPDTEARAYIPRDLWALARLFPVLQTVVEHLGLMSFGRSSQSRVAATLDDVELRRRAVRALRDLLARLADRFLVILHIDDLQWSDADGFRLLTDLLSGTGAPAILMLVSFRSEALSHGPVLRELLEHPPTSHHATIALDPLSDVHAKKMAIELLAAGSSTTDRDANLRHVDAIVAEARGSPFLIEQLVDYVRIEEDPTISLGLGEMLEARLQRHSDQARALLDVLAVAARPTHIAVACQAAGLKLETSELRAMIRRLQAAGFVRWGGGAQEIELYHDRLQEALQAKLLADNPDGVRANHRRLARALSRSGSDDLERLYIHYLGAGDGSKAANYAARAAARASAALAFDQAATFYMQAIALAPVKDSEVLDHRALQVGLGDALANAGRCREAAEAYLKAAQLVRPQQALRLRRTAAEQLLSSGHIDDGLDVLADVLREVGLKLAASPRRALISLIALQLRLRLRGVDFVEADESDLPTDELFRIDVCWAVASGLGMVDSVRAAVFQARGTLLALEAGEPKRVATALSMQAAFAASDGSAAHERALRQAQQALAIAHAQGHPRAIALATMAQGVCTYMIGDWQRAAGQCEAAEIMHMQCTGAVWERITSRRFHLSSRLYMGEYNRLTAVLPGLVADATERGNLYAATDLRLRLNLLWLVADDPVRARAEVDLAMEQWTTGGWHLQHLNALLARAAADLYQSRPVEAFCRLDDAWGSINRSVLLRIEVLRVNSHELRARAAVAALWRDSLPSRLRRRIERVLHQDLAVLSRIELPWVRPQVAAIRACLAAQVDDRQTAVQHLRLASEGFAQANMHGWADCAKHQLVHLAPSTTADGPPPELLAAKGVRDSQRFANLFVPIRQTS